jgi:8-oxo-dGTP diphosphatase
MIQKVGVAGLIYHNNSILAVKRSELEDVFPNVYELPSGKVEFGESPDEAVIREVLEETGLNCSILNIFFIRSYLMKNNTEHKVEIFYELNLKDDTSKNIILSEEHSEYSWVNLDNINTLDLPKEDPVRIIIEKFLLKQT